MPPSGDELILELLCQSVARLEKDDRKRKPEEEGDVTFLKSVKKVRKNAPETATNTDMMESLIVHHYLEKVSPELARKLSALHTLPLVSRHLGKVFPGLSAELPTLQKSPNMSNKRNQRKIVKPFRFTPQEDKIINAAIDEAGEGPISIVSLAKQLDRRPDSVRGRIENLKRKARVLKNTLFTLEEDIILLEALVLPWIGSQKLSKIILNKRHYTILDKRKNGVAQRWTNDLQPWLLQHYSGTLNLRVERMLANYICDTFTDFSSIDWPEVAARTEFAGHTECSLRRVYNAKLRGNTRKKLGLQRNEMTPQHIVDYCDLVYGVEATGRAKAGASINKSRRQSEVISFFEKRMDDLKLKNFL